MKVPATMDTTTASDAVLWQRRAVVFGLCFCYWIYLYFSSRMVIAADAISYETLGEILYKQGWVEYFRPAPNREPFYPFVVSNSMRIAAWLSVPYETIQKIIQILCLFVTQLLTFFILERLRVRESLKLLIVLYMGFSPGIVNAAFSLFSEIIALPFVLATALTGMISWKAIQAGTAKQSFFFGLLSGVILLGGVFSRGVFQLVFYAFVLAYGSLLVFYAFKRKKKIVINTVCYLLIFVFVFQSGMVFYKSLNKKYNGQYEFTDRYPRMLFGNAEKRARKLTFPIFLAHVVSIPGHGFCRLFFTEPECRYCEFQTVDDIYGYDLPKLLKDIPDEEARQEKAISLAKERIFAHPFQFALLTGIEFLRIFFWESTQVGFVDYPPWLQKLFASNFFSDGVRLIVSALSLVAFCFLSYCLFRNRSIVFNPDHRDFEPTAMGLFIFLVISSYGGAYSLFSILTRYALPLAPIYLISIAYFAERIIDYRKTKGLVEK